MPAFMETPIYHHLSNFITFVLTQPLAPPDTPPDFNLALSAPASDGALTSGAMRTLMLVSALKTPATNEQHAEIHTAETVEFNFVGEKGESLDVTLKN